MVHFISAPILTCANSDLRRLCCAKCPATILLRRNVRIRMDTLPNVRDPEWTRSRMDTIPNGHDPEWTRSRMDTFPNGHDPECTRSRMDTIPNGHDPEWTRSQMDTIPNGHDPEWTRSRMDTISNGHDPECALTVNYSYLSLVYVYLVKTFYKGGLNKIIFLRYVS